MHKGSVLIGIDGLGEFFKNKTEASNLIDFFENGSLLEATANVPTDSAENPHSFIKEIIFYFKYIKRVVHMYTLCK